VNCLDKGILLYYILNREARSPLRERCSYRVKGELDLNAMNAACGLLVGENDFIGFARALEEQYRGKITLRVIGAAVVRGQPDTLVFQIKASSFLTHGAEHGGRPHPGGAARMEITYGSWPGWRHGKRNKQIDLAFPAGGH
jgi:hypothetical protein